MYITSPDLAHTFCTSEAMIPHCVTLLNKADLA